MHSLIYTGGGPTLSKKEMCSEMPFENHPSYHAEDRLQ